VGHVVDVFFPRGAGVHIVGDNALKFSFEDGEASTVLLSAVVEIKFVLLDELSEVVVLEHGPVGFGLGGGGDEGS